MDLEVVTALTAHLDELRSAGRGALVHLVSGEKFGGPITLLRPPLATVAGATVVLTQVEAVEAF